MVRVLFVSIAFPPKSDPESIQAGRYFKYLRRDDALRLDVVTSRSPTLNMPLDETLVDLAKGAHQVVEIPLWENRYVQYAIRQVAPDVLQRPDAKASFFWRSARVQKEITDRPDVVYSRSMPMSSAVMAQRLSGAYGVPWVMHLSDPWVGPLSPPGQRRVGAFEASAFEAASAVGVTTPETLQMYAARYPQHAEKLRVFPNVYDDEEVGPAPALSGETLRIVYTGGLAGSRSPEPLFVAIARLLTSRPDLAARLDVVFAGPMERPYRRMFRALPLPCVRHVGGLSFGEARALQRSAHLLLVLDAPTGGTSNAVFLPSKILDYAAVGRRQVAITDADSVTARILDRYALGSWFRHADDDGIARHLAEALERLAARDEDYFAVRPSMPEYSARTNAARLAELLKASCRR